MILFVTRISPGLTSPEMRNPLHIAMVHGHSDVIEYLKREVKWHERKAFILFTRSLRNVGSERGAIYAVMHGKLNYFNISISAFILFFFSLFH